MKQRIPTFGNFQYNDMTQLFELSDNSTLYHRSFKKYKVGDIIQPSVGKKGYHWSEDNVMEIGLEEFRKQNFPNRPSRSNCVYSSVIPRSRFSDKGYLYVVKLIGNYFMTDSLLIDQLNEDLYQNQKDTPGFLSLEDAKKYPKTVMDCLGYYNMNRYWKGVKSLPKNRWGDLEVLSNAVEIIQVIEDSPQQLRPGMDVTVTEDNILKVNISIYNNEDKYNEGRKTLSPKEIKELVKYIETNIIDCKILPKSYNKDIYDGSGFLRKGAKLRILTIRSNNSKNIWTDLDGKNKSKYDSMIFDFYIGKKLISFENKEPMYRLETSGRSIKVYDWGLYLKKS